MKLLETTEIEQTETGRVLVLPLVNNGGFGLDTKAAKALKVNITLLLSMLYDYDIVITSELTLKQALYLCKDHDMISLLAPIVRRVSTWSVDIKISTLIKILNIATIEKTL